MVRFTFLFHPFCLRFIVYSSVSSQYCSYVVRTPQPRKDLLAIIHNLYLLRLDISTKASLIK